MVSFPLQTPHRKFYQLEATSIVRLFKGAFLTEFSSEIDTSDNILAKIRTVRASLFVFYSFLLLAIKHLIMAVIPDIPKPITELLQRQEHIKAGVTSKRVFKSVS